MANTFPVSTIASQNKYCELEKGQTICLKGWDEGWWGEGEELF